MSKSLIPENISREILSVGPQHKNHRGGVGAVIDIYSKYFEQFQFIKSHKPGSKIIKSVVFLQSVFLFVLRLIVNRKIKTIHIHGSTEASFYRKYIFFIIAKNVFRKKVIYHIHGGRYHLFYSNSKNIVKKRIRKLINNADCVICLSESWKKYFLEEFNPKNIKVVANIIDFPLTSNSINKDKQLTFLFLGLICDQKGIFDLLDVLANNRDKYQTKVRLVIGGNGEVDRLKQYINDHDLSSIVEFVGWISSDEKASWLQKADIYILPSYNEGLPISILEAMSYGQPVISTTVGGIPEIVHKNKNGILIEPGDKKAIESSIDFFLESPGMIEKYGELSKSFVEKHLPEAVMNELMLIYKS